LIVEFHERIRGIEKFESPAHLAAAMQADAEAARRLLVPNARFGSGLP
jgi:FAD synthase